MDTMGVIGLWDELLLVVTVRHWAEYATTSELGWSQVVFLHEVSNWVLDGQMLPVMD